MSYATIQEVNTSIMFSNFTNEQLTSIIDAVQYARAQLRKDKIRAFRKGDTVKFTSGRNGIVYVGVVSKVKLKNVLVDCPKYDKGTRALVNVPANMLESA